MQITAHTSLDSILKSEDVIGLFMTAADSLRKGCTFPRLNYLRDEIAKPGIKDSLIDGANTMYSNGASVKSSYDTFHTALYNLQESIRTKSINKEKEELTELISKIDKYLIELEADYDAIISSMNSEEDPVELQRLEQQASRKKQSIITYEDKRTDANTRLTALGGTYTATETPTNENGSDTSSLSHGQHTEYSITRGDSVVIDGQQYTFEFLGIDQNGDKRAYYSDGNGNVFYIDSNGNRTDTEYNAITGFAHHVSIGEEIMLYHSYQTSEENASQLNLPRADAITPPSGDNTEIMDADMMDIYVDYGNPNTADVTHVNNSTELHEAAANHAPVITVDATQLEDNQKWWQNLLSGSNDVDAGEGASQITLVYNEGTGMYYPLNSDGSYEMDMYCELTPEKLQSFTIEN